MNNLPFYFLAGLPSLKGIVDYITKEGGYAIIIVMVVWGIKSFADQKYGKMLSIFIIGGLLLWFVGAPESLTNAVKAFWELITT